MRPLIATLYLIVTLSFRVIVTVLDAVLLLLFLLFTTTSNDVTLQPHHQATFKNLEQATLHFGETNDTVFVGWHQSSLLPAQLPFPTAGYGVRPWVQRIRDTTKVRAVIIEKGSLTVALISLDLLIFPPIVKKEITSYFDSLGIQLYLSATHTHSGPGGWAQKWGGHFLAGKFHEDYIELLVHEIKSAVVSAKVTRRPAQFSSFRISVPGAVRNRLVGTEGHVDTWLRGLCIYRNDGSKGLLFTYAAHANCLDTDANHFSGDYPNVLNDSIQKHGVQWSAYMAGAVGSHGPKIHGFDGETNIQLTGSMLWKAVRKVLDTPPVTTYTPPVAYCRYSVQLPEPQLRVSPELKIRPWVFYTFLGKDNPEIQSIKIDNTVLISLPCDYSGEFMPELENQAQATNTEIVVTGFNGGYIGYITPDKYYFLDKGEVRDMNWYGPGNGAYFLELNKRTLSKYTP
ncbi:MAG: neutral/alkaline non-lysosomal ceramidase N-terminal domain-containing protein [Cytophagaceae bacterium]|jgi:hypothetical protein|nr:neutral/alkaline non-lysosomal ceramidase N-terminal domain-containing protein [Cytophagaceae bacterium]